MKESNHITCSFNYIHPKLNFFQKIIKLFYSKYTPKTKFKPVKVIESGFVVYDENGVIIDGSDCGVKEVSTGVYEITTNLDKLTSGRTVECKRKFNN